MSDKERSEVERFRVRSADGQYFVVVVYQTFIIVRSMSGVSRIPGLKDGRTLEGYHVNFNDDNSYEIVELGIQVTKVV